MTHTPGPWKWSVGDPQIIILHTGEDYIGDANILWADRCKACAERDARCGWPKKEDANLIAAAPEMYEALKNLADTPAHDTEAIAEAWDQAYKAIAKAEGK